MVVVVVTVGGCRGTGDGKGREGRFCTCACHVDSDKGTARGSENV